MPLGVIPMEKNAVLPVSFVKLFVLLKPLRLRPKSERMGVAGQLV